MLKLRGLTKCQGVFSRPRAITNYPSSCDPRRRSPGLSTASTCYSPRTVVCDWMSKSLLPSWLHLLACDLPITEDTLLHTLHRHTPLCGRWGPRFRGGRNVASLFLGERQTGCRFQTRQQIRFGIRCNPESRSGLQLRSSMTVFNPSIV